MVRLRWLLWLAYIAAWTTALLLPVPSGPWDLAAPASDLKHILAKAIHVSAYGFLAVLTGWLRAPFRWRWLLVFVITAHGTVTELLQLATATRTGLLTDVGFDNLGVGLGLVLSWKWWSATAALDGEPGA